MMNKSRYILTILLFMLSILTNYSYSKNMGNQYIQSKLVKHSVSSEDLLRRFLLLIKNLSSNSISEFSKQKLKSSFKLPIIDMSRIANRVPSGNLIEEYGNGGESKDGWEFIFEVENYPDKKTFMLNFGSADKNKITCSLNEDKFIDEIKKYGFKELYNDSQYIVDNYKDKFDIDDLIISVNNSRTFINDRVYFSIYSNPISGSSLNMPRCINSILVNLK